MDLQTSRRELILRRVPLFAAAWLATAVFWTVVLLAEGLITPMHALMPPAVQALVLGVTLFLVRFEPVRARIAAAVAVAIALLGVAMTATFAAVGGDGDVLAFVLMALYVSSALCFPWGWRMALGVLVAILTSWVLVTPWLRFFVPTIELVAAVVMGSTVCLAIAEMAARGFAAAVERDERARHAARGLAASLDAYRDLAENAPDMIYTHDLEGRLTYVNEAVARYVDASLETLVGRNCRELMALGHPEAPDLRDVIARIASGEAVPPVLIPVERPTGLQWVECTASAMHDATGACVGVRGIARDVTARRAVEERLRASIAELRQSEEVLRLLSRRQATLGEEERKRIGFGLHDHVCQDLVGIGILLESLRRRLPEVPRPEANSLTQIGRYLNEVLDHLRGVAHELRPLLLRDLGLEGGLRSLGDGMSSSQTPVTVTFRGAVPRLADDVEIGVYRIAQEALANAVRHSHARSITLTLTTIATKLDLEVSDDGCGFSAADKRPHAHLGLIGMRERALALGGWVGVTSAPGKGTSVRLQCPFALPAPRAVAS
jgi:PAS domain S-box-containing protein